MKPASRSPSRKTLARFSMVQGLFGGLGRGLRPILRPGLDASRKPGPSGTDQGNNWANFIDRRCAAASKRTCTRLSLKARSPPHWCTSRTSRIGWAGLFILIPSATPAKGMRKRTACSGASIGSRLWYPTKFELPLISCFLLDSEATLHALLGQRQQPVGIQAHIAREQIDKVSSWLARYREHILAEH